MMRQPNLRTVVHDLTRRINEFEARWDEHLVVCGALVESFEDLRRCVEANAAQWTRAYGPALDGHLSRINDCRVDAGGSRPTGASAGGVSGVNP